MNGEAFTPVRVWTCIKYSNMTTDAQGRRRVIPGTKYLSLVRYRSKYQTEQCLDCPAWIPKHGNRKYCAGCREARYRADNAAARERMQKSRSGRNKLRDENYRKLGRPVPEPGKRGRPKGARDFGTRRNSPHFRPGIDDRKEGATRMVSLVTGQSQSVLTICSEHLVLNGEGKNREREAAVRRR